MIHHIMKDAMGDLWTMPLSSLSTTEALTLKKITPTKLPMADVTSIGSVFTLENLYNTKDRKQEEIFSDSLVIFLQKNAKVVTIDGYEDVPENDEKSLEKAVANQPVSVAIEAGGREFQLYQSVKFFLWLYYIFSK